MKTSPPLPKDSQSAPLPRRQWILKASQGASLAALSPFCLRAKASNPQKHHKWRLVMSIPKTLPVWGEGVLVFAEQVRLMSSGRLDIQVYGAGELTPALEVFDAVQSGLVEMGHSASYYWQGKMPAAPFFTSIPFGMTATGMRAWIHRGGGLELWRELYGRYDVIPFLAGNTGLQMAGWFHRKIQSPEDLKGLKMRIPGLGGKVMQAAGAQPMLVAGGEIYTSLATGVIDAAEWVGPCHDYVLGLHKAARYYAYPGWQEPGPCLELLIHRQAWESLDTDLRAIIEHASAALDAHMHAHWLAEDARYFRKIKNESQVEVVAIPDEVLSVLRKHTQNVLSEVAQHDAISRRIYQSYQDFESQLADYLKFNEWAYADALRQSPAR